MVLSIVGSYDLFAGWQPIPYIGLDTDPTKAVYITFPRIESGYATNAFNSNRDKITLADFIFGETPLIQDIFLASKVAGLGDTNVATGNYLSLIGTTTLLLGASQTCLITNLAASYSLPVGSSDVLWINEVTLPIESWRQEMAWYYGGTGFGNTLNNTVANPGTFFESYSDLTSFIRKEVFVPKGLSVNLLQSEVVIGSIRLVSALDFSNYFFENVSVGQVGFVAHLISPKSSDPNIVWPIEAGFGATYLGCFGQVRLNFNAISNPFFICEITPALPNDVVQRVPMLKSPSPAFVAAGAATFGNSNILTSTNLAGTSITKNFSLFDSTIPFVADQTVLVRRHRGTMIEAKIGNVVDCGPLQIAVWYEYAHRGTDHHKLSPHAFAGAQDNVYDFALLGRNTKNTYNIIGWKGMYTIDGVKFTIGMNCTVAGKTAPQYYVSTFEMEVGF